MRLDAGTVVGDGEHRELGFGRELHVDVAPCSDDAARVVDEVRDHLLEAVDVAEDLGRLAADAERHAAVLDERLEHGGCAVRR
jgi:hypothetical protein